MYIHVVRWFKILGIAAVGATVFGAIILADVAERKKWDAFLQQHHCVIVGKMDGELVPTYGFGSNGQMSMGVAATSDRTGWKCDDGVTYWK